MPTCYHARSASHAQLNSWSHLWREQKNDFVLVKVHGDDRTSIDDCLIHNIREHSTLIIEDDDLADAIMTEMRNAGVPIVSKEEYPSGQSDLERLITELVKSGKSISEVRAGIDEYQRQRGEDTQTTRLNSDTDISPPRPTAGEGAGG